MRKLDLHSAMDLVRYAESRGHEFDNDAPNAFQYRDYVIRALNADVPYDQLLDLDQSNPRFGQTDVVLVIGANDVVNPEARNPNSAIAGMPIIDCDKARTCIVIKRSLSPGFAGIPNPLFAAENALMYFGDGKKAIQAIIQAVKEND